MFLIVFLHHILFTAGAPTITVQTSLFVAEISLANFLVAQVVRAWHQSVTTVFLHMRLDVTARKKLPAAFRGQGTAHLDFIAHVDQQAGYAGRDVTGGGSARGTRELFRIGRAEGGYGRLEAFLTENVIALEARRVDKGAVADRTHEVGVVVGDKIEGAQVNEFVIVAFGL